MAIRLDNIMERWAALFKEIHHTEAKPRFFRYNDEMALDEFIQRYKQTSGPIAGIRTHLEGHFDTSKRMDYPEEQFAILIRADSKDYLKQANAKHQCKLIMKKFLVYLEKLKKEAQQTDRTAPLALLRLDEVRYETLGPIAGEWFGVFVSVDNVDWEKLCFSDADYLTEDEANWIDKR